VSSELATETSSEPVADLAEGSILSETTDPGAAGLTAGLTRLADSLVGDLLDRVGVPIEWLEDLTSKLAQAVSWLLGGGNGVPSPAKYSFAPPASPASGAPPPAVPIPSGGYPPAAGSFLGGPASSGSASGGPFGQFGSWHTLSVPLVRGGTLYWPWREVLRPSSVPKSAIERPG